MARSIGLSHVVRQPDGAYVGVWGGYVLSTAFQPIFAFENGKLVPAAYEGLLRPTRNDAPISPATFFGLVPAVDRMSVETLARTLHLLNAGVFLDPSVMVFVNFDPSVFVDASLADVALRDMRLVLHEAGLEPSRIVCEVTEHPTSSEATLHGFVEALRANGFRIALDDYGSEDSDMNRVERLKPDIVKFDARWVTDLMGTGAGTALLSEMVEAFSARGIVTLFEGLEETWQLELAERCGVAMVQGYVVARPEKASAFPKERPVPTTTGPAGAVTPAPQPQPARTGAKPFGRRPAAPG